LRALLVEAKYFALSGLEELVEAEIRKRSTENEALRSLATTDLGCGVTMTLAEEQRRPRCKSRTNSLESEYSIYSARSAGSYYSESDLPRANVEIPAPTALMLDPVLFSSIPDF
jgi:hypothetical protein